MASSVTKNILLAVLSTIVALILFIGAYELVKNYQYEKWKSEYQESGDWYGKLTMPSGNKVLMWEYRPDSEGWDSGVTIKTNKQGFRDYDHEFAREDGVQRIAFAGDSVTLGIGVDAEDTFVRRFSDMSRQMVPGSNVEALNISVDGYNALQVLELARTWIPRFMPDKAVYVLCMNDFDFLEASGGKIKYFRKPKSFFLSMLEQLYRQYFEYHNYYFDKNKKLVYQEIARTNDFMKELGVEFYVVLLPVFPAEGFSHYPLTRMHKDLATMLAADGIPVIDLLGAFIEQDKPPRSYALDIWHLDKTGHRFVASRLVKTILSPPETDHSGVGR
jgi:lysophospholipase L1-like esterase